MKDSRIGFKENQKFNQWWLWLILLGIGIIPIIGLYTQLILKENFGTNPTSCTGLVVFFVIIFSLITFFWLVQLRTEINNEEILLEFTPFINKRINWTEVKSAVVVDHGCIGSGVRLGSKYGTVYTIKGRKGLAIKLHCGDQFVIGTQKEKELKKFLKESQGLFD